MCVFVKIFEIEKFDCARNLPRKGKIVYVCGEDGGVSSSVCVFAAGGVFFCRRWLCLCMLFCYKSEYSCATYALNNDDDECKTKKYPPHTTL